MIGKVVMPTKNTDTMTAKERIAAALTGKPFDRIPVSLLISDYAARLLGVTVTEYESSAELLAKGQFEAWQRYGIDIVNTGPGLTGIPEALGCKLALPDGSPYIAEHPVKTESDLDKLKLPDPWSTARLPLFLEAAKLLQKYTDGGALVTMTTSGPMTTAAALRGTENFMRDFRKNKDFAHRLLAFATEGAKIFAKAAAEVGVRVTVADPVASGTLISKSLFKEFALPYLKDEIHAIKDYTGGFPVLHICGNTSLIWEEMADTDSSVLSLDNAVSLADAKKQVGHRVALLGNITPTSTMLHGSEEDVKQDALFSLISGYDNPKGYVLGLGCGLPINTPESNIYALMKIAREYGKYPIDREKIERDLIRKDS